MLFVLAWRSVMPSVHVEAAGGFGFCASDPAGLERLARLEQALPDGLKSLPALASKGFCDFCASPGSAPLAASLSLPPALSAPHAELALPRLPDLHPIPVYRPEARAPPIPA